MNTIDKVDCRDYDGGGITGTEGEASVDRLLTVQEICELTTSEENLRLLADSPEENSLHQDPGHTSVQTVSHRQMARFAGGCIMPVRKR